MDTRFYYSLKSTCAFICIPFPIYCDTLYGTCFKSLYKQNKARPISLVIMDRGVFPSRKTSKCETYNSRNIKWKNYLGQQMIEMLSNLVECNVTLPYRSSSGLFISMFQDVDGCFGHGRFGLGHFGQAFFQGWTFQTDFFVIKFFDIIYKIS